MDIIDDMKRMLGTPEEIEILGNRIKAYPLKFEEYMEALTLLPIPDFTMDEIEQLDKGNSPQSVMEKMMNDNFSQKSFKHQSYVLKVTLEKNNISTDSLNDDVRLFHAMNPLYVLVWEISQPTDVLKKNK